MFQIANYGEKGDIDAYLMEDDGVYDDGNSYESFVPILDNDEPTRAEGAVKTKLFSSSVILFSAEGDDGAVSDSSSDRDITELRTKTHELELKLDSSSKEIKVLQNKLCEAEARRNSHEKLLGEELFEVKVEVGKGITFGNKEVVVAPDILRSASSNQDHRVLKQLESRLNATVDMMENLTQRLEFVERENEELKERLLDHCDKSNDKRRSRKFCCFW